MTSDPIVAMLLEAYRAGAFPMADPATGRVDMYTTEIRGVIPLHPPDAFHVSRSLQREIRRGRFTITSDRDFGGVIRGCADMENRRRRTPGVEDETWIDATITDWFERLHRAGKAHSIEAWRTDEDGRDHLVGGVYGLAIGAAFFAESKFHVARPRLPDGGRDPIDGSNASKICLVHLVEHLRACGFDLLDVQFNNDHIRQFGVREISARQYQSILAAAVRRPECWRPLSEARADEKPSR